MLDALLDGFVALGTSPRLWLGAVAFAILHTAVLQGRQWGIAKVVGERGMESLEERPAARFTLRLVWIGSELLSALVLVAVVAFLVPAILTPPALPADWSFPTRPLEWVAATVAVAVVFMIWRWIPFLGQLLEAVPPLASYVVGIWALHLLVDGARAGPDLPFPGLLATVLFAAAGLAAYFVAAYLALDWEREEPLESLSGRGLFLLRVAGALAAFVPLVMYGSLASRVLGG